MSEGPAVAEACALSDQGVVLLLVVVTAFLELFKTRLENT
jgi:hypothetical protein